MISIDFVAGTHGNFLEYVCNVHIFDLDVDYLPFNFLGASHLKTKKYLNNRFFVADHYSELQIPLNKKIITIKFDPDDLLSLTSNAFLKAGDSNIHNNELEVDTYNKLYNSKYFAHLIEQINSAYPKNKISKDKPDCPRHILREFFKFGFADPSLNGFTKKLEQLVYNHSYDTIDFHYKNFYNKDLFLEGITKISHWAGFQIKIKGLENLWQEFFKRQIFKDDKTQCDKIIGCIKNSIEHPITNLTMLQESYINGILEKEFGIEMPFYQPVYFSNTREIIKHLCFE
jgi:hypothetical protein